MKLAISIFVFCALFAFNDAKLVRIYGDVTNYPLIGKERIFAAGDFNGRIHRKVIHPKVNI